MSGKPVEILQKSEGALQVITLPLSSTGSDGKATRYQIRNEKGETLCLIDAAAKSIGVYYPHILQLPAFTAAQRDAVASPVGGMLIYNSDDRTVEVYRTSSGWTALVF